MNYSHNFRPKNDWSNRNVHDQQGSSNNSPNNIISKYTNAQNFQNVPNPVCNNTQKQVNFTSQPNTFTSFQSKLTHPQRVDDNVFQQFLGQQVKFTSTSESSSRMSSQHIQRNESSPFRGFIQNVTPQPPQLGMPLSNVPQTPVTYSAPINFNNQPPIQSGASSMPFKSQGLHINQNNFHSQGSQTNPMHLQAMQNIHSQEFQNTIKSQVPQGNIHLQGLKNNIPSQGLQSNIQPRINIAMLPPSGQVVRPPNIPRFFNIPPPRNVAPNSFNSEFIRQPPPPPPIRGPYNSMFIDSTTNKSLPQLAQTSPSTQSMFPIPFPMTPQIFPSVCYGDGIGVPRMPIKPVSEKENKLLKFLERFRLKKKRNLQSEITVQRFRIAMQKGLSIVKNLTLCKENLKQLLQSDEKEWSAEVKKASFYQEQLIQICAFLTMPKHLDGVQEKLKLIKKRRTLKKKLKQNVMNERIQKLKQREELNHEIDKWLDSIKEKNLKLKREVEMKKEADSILSEVRKKIQEAKRTIEKIKVFEKLRNARQASAEQKGLFLPEHDEKFQSSILHMKETIHKQLSHYEDEERALKVMLEAEQEGQLEEEALWKIKKMKSFQEKRQKNILQCLFGDSDEPEKDEPIYLFYQHQNSGTKSIENLVQIRNQWDMHIDENGESIPQQWIVPVPPSSSVWEDVHAS